MQKKFDYIIAGGGAAGLSLVYYMLEQPALAKKTILIIDKEEKNENDRTWCFWQTGESPFEEILQSSWSKLEFHTQTRSMLLNIAPYSYKMLRSRDFYQFCKSKIQASPNVTWVFDEIESLDEAGWVKGKSGKYYGEMIFNSALVDIPKKEGKHYLLQHFKGWFVKTKEEVFDPQKPILMDFRIDQGGDCRFMYVLPSSKTHALVEYTLFSAELLNKNDYEIALKDYFVQFLGDPIYEIEEHEFGVIPMTNLSFPTKKGENIFHIGTAGGHTKASTGYTFAFIQKKSRQIAQNLATGKSPYFGMDSALNKYALFDSIFLRVIAEKNFPAWKVFDDMFKNLPASLVMSFLDENTNLLQDIRVMNSVHIPTFLKSAIKEIF